MYAAPIEALIKAFGKLPSVGRRTAERYVFALLKSGKKDASMLAQALTGLLQQVQSCKTCWDFSDDDTCPVCADKARDQSVICVVSEPQEKQVIERSGAFKGQYHLLRGKVTTDTIDRLHLIKVKELAERCAPESAVKEVILALSPDMQGESTMLFLERELASINPELKISRLARGLPMGSDLQYADDITLQSAIRHRTS